MSNFVEHLNRIVRRTGMYFYSGTLIEATSFIAGMDLMQESPISEDFREWLLRNKLKTRSSVCWPVLVKMYMEDNRVSQDDEVDVFLSLIVEFNERAGYECSNDG